MSEGSLLQKLRGVIVSGDYEVAAKAAEEAVRGGIDPIEAMSELRKAMKELGDAFGKGELFLTNLMMGAEAMKAIMEVLRPELLKWKRPTKTLGKIVIGTVQGDIHDIGKSIVGTMLFASGFEVVDLGIDVPDEVFVKKVQEIKPDVLGLSALMTTTKMKQKDVVSLLDGHNLRDEVKIIVGGAAASDEWAREIGADAYAPDAVAAVATVKELLGIREA